MDYISLKEYALTVLLAIMKIRILRLVYIVVNLCLAVVLAKTKLIVILVFRGFILMISRTNVCTVIQLFLVVEHACRILLVFHVWLDTISMESNVPHVDLSCLDASFVQTMSHACSATQIIISMALTAILVLK